MRLIDADALLDFTQMIAGIENACSFETFQYAVEHARTIDAVLSRHGQWKTLPNGNIQCTRCGHEPCWDSADWELNCGKPHYCSKCGANMMR